MAKAPEMNADFAGWYAEAFMDEGAVRTARWKGVVETAQAANFTSVEVLLRYAFDTEAPADGGKNEKLAAQHQAILATISGNSTAMNPATSRRELQVLSAATLVRLFSTLPDAAIAVLTTAFDGARKPDVPMDLVGLAKRALVELADANHARPEAKEFKIVAPKVDFEVSAEAVASMSADIWKAELDRLRNAAQVAMQDIADKQNSVAELLVEQKALADEELQMLWWLIGGQSVIADAPFKNVEPSARPLTFAKELGRITNVSPGPASVRAMFQRAGVSDELLSVAVAINAIPQISIDDFTSATTISPVTTPLHFALDKRGELASDEIWLPVWSAMTKLPADASLPAVKIAELFYYEHLFLHVAG